MLILGSGVGLELLSSSDPPLLASLSARITGVSHCVWPTLSFKFQLCEHLISDAHLFHLLILV
uniref:Uncharacterized protein n=1 Tax=Prolemur simus TaxID=1328070 RepID=A0A8C9A6M5_PROSS